MIGNCAEIQLFLNANLEWILLKSTRKQDDDHAAAEQLLDPIDVGNDVDDMLSEAEDTDSSAY